MIELSTTKGQHTKKKIISTAARMFLTKGYHGTGINEILVEADVPKGSFYFHFTSKKDLARQVAEYYSTRLEIWVARVAEGKTWPEFITALVEEMKVLADDGRYFGCPLGVLGVEIAFVEPSLAQGYAQAMDRITLIFAGVLARAGLSSPEAAIMAKRAFALYQGHLQYYRLTKQVEVFERMVEDLLSILKK